MDFHQPDWPGIARMFGFEASHATSEGEFCSQVDSSIEIRKPGLVTVSYNAEDYDKILSMVR